MTGATAVDTVAAAALFAIAAFDDNKVYRKIPTPSLHLKLDECFLVFASIVLLSSVAVVILSLHN